MTTTGLVEPGDKREESGSEHTEDVAGASTLAENGRNGARRRGAALRALLRNAGAGAISGTARYAAERFWDDLLGK